jgi:hypothetical protein
MRAPAQLQRTIGQDKGRWLSGKKGPGKLPGNPFHAIIQSSVGGRRGHLMPGTGKGPGREVVRGGHFRLRLPVFPDQMTLFPEKMTLLFQDTLISTAEWHGHTLAMAEK